MKKDDDNNMKMEHEKENAPTPIAEDLNHYLENPTELKPNPLFISNFYLEVLNVYLLLKCIG